MEITTVDLDDDVEISQLFDNLLAAHQADEPDNAEPSATAFPINMRTSSAGEDVVNRVARVDGKIVGHSKLHFPNKDNLHFGYGNLTVHPQYRRRGIGTALLSASLDIVRGNGRRSFGLDTLASGTWDGSPKRSEAGKLFLERHGFKLAQTSINRRADLTAVDQADEQRHYEHSLAKSQDYETIAWTGRVPEELLAPVAELNSTFLAEAPIGDLDLEPEKIDADRMRRNDDREAAKGTFMCGVVARRKGEERVIANTVIGVPREPGHIGHQWMTLVAPDHRGHRLGLRVKIENHRQLRAAKPQVRLIDTDNADNNTHMIAVNEILGFKPVDYLLEYQLDVDLTS
jgi:GNAT superfamily N-acetyltransferase